MNSYFFGFSYWKRKQTKKFFLSIEVNEIVFCKNLEDAKEKGLDKNSKIYIWGKKEFTDLEVWAKDNVVQIYRVEDGFIRSVSLGSDLTKAYSLVVDSRGIYFDPTTQSDLEYIVQTYEFDEKLLQRAKYVKNYLIENKLSKYNVHQDKYLSFDTHKKIVLVIGQVEDDASIKYGGDGMSNLELLQKVHEKKSDEYIIYKAHPDVEAGNRKGKIDRDIVLGYVDETIDDVSLPSLLDVCDEVHTITSLSGFEALLREKRVYTYGMPFYASWGLTIDEKECARRDRSITLLELIAATYIVYPRYISPINGKFCEVENVLEELSYLKNRYSNNWKYRYYIDIRNYISRKIQFIIGSISKLL